MESSREIKINFVFAAEINIIAVLGDLVSRVRANCYSQQKKIDSNSLLII
ncbi:hypothetical protein SAMN05216365_11210 [Porphyromonadaceae bacterium NLAE-zl-C104]|nr:hypothetical protein SAMN05216331_11139 [Porphyromonadaceae bacterium KH3R12]SFS62579.1 hypothetical protein SAMN05216365_11210 [Porphyromonadaceae bacterium NLAE-zl-C104]